MKRALSCLWLTLGLPLIASVAGANPQGPQVAHGQANFQLSGTGALTVTNTPDAIVNWQSFSVGNQETVRFVQQHAGSAILNRVIGQDPSAILGQLMSNGRVFLINPNGLVVGPGASIDTAGFVGSTLNITDEDFLAGRLRFEGGPDAGAIRNQGLISARGDGGVYLIAPDIENSGVIRTDSGALLLAAGHKVALSSLDLDSISVEVQAPDDEAVNLGHLLTGGGALGVFAGAIRNHGVLEANAAVVGPGGEIRLVAASDIDVTASALIAADGAEGGGIHIESETGTTSLSGTVQARGLRGAGGEVQILGERVGLFDSAQVDVSGASGGGSALIGGGYQGGDAEVKNASKTYVSSVAVINADAQVAGDGGEVIVWADDSTQFLGRLSARGGSASGDGGFAEVSGRRILDFRGHVDLSAGNGAAGTLLLDPNDLVIKKAADFGVPAMTPFVTTQDNAVLDVDTLTSELSSSNVVVQTGSGGANSQAGNILVEADIVSGDPNDLTLVAAHDIFVNASIDTGKDLTLNAAHDIIVNASIDTSNDLTLDAASTVFLGANIDSGNDQNVIAGETIAFSADMDLTGAGTLHLSAGRSVAFTFGTGTVPRRSLAYTEGSVVVDSALEVLTETDIHAATIDLAGPVTGSSPLVLLPSGTTRIGSGTGSFLSDGSVARLRDFSGGLSIGGSIPGVAGAGFFSGTAPALDVSTELRTAGDLALVSFGDISVLSGGALGWNGGTLTVAAGLGSTMPLAGNITDPGAGPLLYFQAPEIVLIANGTVGTATNPLSVLTDATTVSVGSGTGRAFIDGIAGLVLGGGPLLIRAIYDATCSGSCSYDSAVLSTTVTDTTTPPPTLPDDVAEPEDLAAALLLAEKVLGKAAEDAAQSYNVRRLIKLGPQLPVEFNIAKFAATGLVKAGWPILFSYETGSSGGIQLRVTAPGVAPLAFEAGDSGGSQRTVVLSVPERFGDSVVPAVFEVVASPGSAGGENEATGAQVHALGAGPKAVGSVAIQSIMFQPPYVRAGAGQTAAYRFFSKSNFDEVAAEFMQITPAAPGAKYNFVNRQLIDGGVQQDHWVGDTDRRAWNGKAETGQLSPGGHKLQVRAWDDAGQWITAWSDALVTVAP